MNKIKTLLIILGFALPYLVIYKAFFFRGPLAFGDAPFFSPENLKELFNQPLLWNFKDTNLGAPQYYIIWLYLPTFIYGLLNHFWGLGNDLLVRLVFYFPATTLGLIGTWVFLGRFTTNTWSKFLGSFLYGFNTYLLMLIDGGQVGVSLAYGLFPLTAASLLNYVHDFSLKNYFGALLLLLAILSADIRIALILLIFVVFVISVERSCKIEIFVKRLALMGLSVAGLSAYWLVPVITSSGIGDVASLSGLNNGGNFVTLLDSLFLFQPHFPLNQFGKVFPLPFYFSLLLLIILGCLPLLFKVKDLSQRRRVLLFSLLFLFLAFLAKGGSDPLGEGYSFLMNKLPLGTAFRDSSKFYTPLILTGSVLLTLTVDALRKVFIKKFFFVSMMLLIYIYLLVLIYPAILGNLSGVLRSSTENKDFQEISQRIGSNRGFTRSLWFEEKPPLGYFSWDKPALSANNLYMERPFASMIEGKYDLFNFLHNPQATNWLRLLGIKYVFFPEDQRKKEWSAQERDERQQFLQFVNTIPGLWKLSWPLSFPAFEITNSMPHLFAQKKAYLVVGGEEIYQHLFQGKNFNLASQGFIFTEEGRVNLNDLMKVEPNSLEIILEKEKIDLTMAALKKLMISPYKAQFNQWGLRGKEDYLIWRYDFLQHGIKISEFDYAQGVAFSTQRGEKITFKINVPQRGDYYLAVRFTSATLQSGMKVTFSDRKYVLNSQNDSRFQWELLGPVALEKGEQNIEFINDGNFVVLNTLALVGQEDFSQAQKLTERLMSRFPVLKINGDDDWPKLANSFNDNYILVPYKMIDPTKYKIDFPANARWLVFSDHFHSDWRINGVSSLNFPFYAMINGLYVVDPGDNILAFSPQENVKEGIILSVASLLAIVITAIFLKRKTRKNV